MFKRILAIFSFLAIPMFGNSTECDVDKEIQLDRLEEIIEVDVLTNAESLELKQLLKCLPDTEEVWEYFDMDEIEESTCSGLDSSTGSDTAEIGQ